MKKTLSTFLIITLTTVSLASSFLIPSNFALADDLPTGGGSGGDTGNNGLFDGSNSSSETVAQPSSSSEAATAGSANKPQSSNTATNAGSAIGGAVSCAAGQLLANVLTATISSAIKGEVTGVVTGITGSPGAPAVPTEITKGDVKDDTNMSTWAHTGSGAPGGIFSGVSWDAIAFCIGNALIQYIGNSVINWINTGFQGNPAFVANPQQFFSDIADKQASDFLLTLNGAASQAMNQTLGGFQQALTGGLVRGYNSNVFSNNNNTMGQVITSPNSWYAGTADHTLSGLHAAATQQGNNFPSIYYNIGVAMGGQISKTVNTAASQIVGGYKPVTNCQTNPNGTQGPCVTTVPAGDIDKAGQDARNLSNLRLVAAQKFDQVISALVNEMIKVALNKILTSNTKK